MDPTCSPGEGVRRDLLERAKDGKEHLVVTDRDGKVIGFNVGNDESVDYPSDLRTLVNTPGAGLTSHHTHPYDSPPSMSDILNLSDHVGVDALQVYSEAASYRVTVVGDRRDLYFAAKKAYSDSYIKLVDRAIGGEKLTPEYVNYHTAEVALKDLVDKGLIKYERRPK